MISCSQFRTQIIRPVLHLIDRYTPGDEELLVATVAHESLGGFYLHQANGPACGIYQMEPATYNYVIGKICSWSKNSGNSDDICKFISDLYQGLFLYAGYKFMLPISVCDFPSCTILNGNMFYSTLMAYCLYRLRIGLDSVIHADLDSLWANYKQHWNTSAGEATETPFRIHYQDFVKS